jgi:hypothetical protein
MKGEESKCNNWVLGGKDAEQGKMMSWNEAWPSRSV